jgi:prefoldin subunit 5
MSSSSEMCLERLEQELKKLRSEHDRLRREVNDLESRHQALASAVVVIKGDSAKDDPILRDYIPIPLGG